VVPVVLGVPQRGRLGIRGDALVAGVRVAEDVQPLRVGGHDSVFDPVVYHLNEMTGARGTTVQIAALGSAWSPGASPGAERFADARCERGEDGVEPLDGSPLASDH